MSFNAWDLAEDDRMDAYARLRQRELDSEVAALRGRYAMSEEILRQQERQRHQPSSTELRFAYPGRRPAFRMPASPTTTDTSDDMDDIETTINPIHKTLFYTPKPHISVEKNAAEKSVDAYMLAQIESMEQQRLLEMKTEQMERGHINSMNRYQTAINKLHLEEKYAQTLRELEWAQKAYEKEMALEASKVNRKAETCAPVSKIMQNEEALMMDKLAENALKKMGKEHAIEDLEGYYDDLEENFQASAPADNMPPESISFDSLLKVDSLLENYFTARRQTDQSPKLPKEETRVKTLATKMEPPLEPVFGPKMTTRLPSRSIAIQVKPRVQSTYMQSDDLSFLHEVDNTPRKSGYDSWLDIQDSLRHSLANARLRPSDFIQSRSPDKSSRQRNDDYSIFDYPPPFDPFRDTADIEEYWRKMEEIYCPPIVEPPSITAVPLSKPIRTPSTRQRPAQRRISPAKPISAQSKSLPKKPTPQPRTSPDTSQVIVKQKQSPNQTNPIQESIMKVLSNNSPNAAIQINVSAADDRERTVHEEVPNLSTFVNVSQSKSDTILEQFSELEEESIEEAFPNMTVQQYLNKLILDPPSAAENDVPSTSRKNDRNVPFVYHELSTIDEMDSKSTDLTTVESEVDSIPSSTGFPVDDMVDKYSKDVTYSDLISNIKMISSKASSSEESQGFMSSRGSSPRDIVVNIPQRSSSSSTESRVMSLLKKVRKERDSTQRSSGRFNVLLDAANDMMQSISDIRLVTSSSDDSPTTKTTSSGLSRSSSIGSFKTLLQHSESDLENLPHFPRISSDSSGETFQTMSWKSDLNSGLSSVPLRQTSEPNVSQTAPLTMGHSSGQPFATLTLRSRSPSDDTRIVRGKDIEQDPAAKDLRYVKKTWSSSSEESLSQMFAPNKKFFQSTPMKMSMKKLAEEKGISDEPDLTLVGSEISANTSRSDDIDESRDNERLSQSMLSFLQHEISNIADDEEEVTLMSSPEKSKSP